MDPAGVEVSVAAPEDYGHVVGLRELHGLRSLELPVERGFDATALRACCSLALCPGSPLAREWPEFVALARTALEAPDVGVSDRGRP
jgi:hypothetical protein